MNETEGGLPRYRPMGDESAPTNGRRRERSKGTTPLASYSLRLGGFIIDLLVLEAVLELIAIAFHLHLSVHSGHHNALSVSHTAEILQFVLWVVYGSACWGFARHQSLGMAVCRTSVVDAQSGEGLGFERALVRSLVFGLCLATGFLAIVDLLWPLWDRRNQTLHDKAARSVVIRLTRA